jgi:RhoGAP domain/PH domain
LRIFFRNAKKKKKSKQKKKKKKRRRKMLALRVRACDRTYQRVELDGALKKEELTDLLVSHYGLERVESNEYYLPSRDERGRGTWLECGQTLSGAGLRDGDAVDAKQCPKPLYIMMGEGILSWMRNSFSRASLSQFEAVQWDYGDALLDLVPRAEYLLRMRVSKDEFLFKRVVVSSSNVSDASSDPGGLASMASGSGAVADLDVDPEGLGAGHGSVLAAASSFQSEWLNVNMSLREQGVGEQAYVLAVPASCLNKLHLDRLGAATQHSSWLNKRSIKEGKMTHQKKRWCVLSGSFLFYFKNQGGLPAGVVPLEYYSMSDSVSGGRSQFELAYASTGFRRAGANYLFAADTEQDLEKWTSAIRPICINGAGKNVFGVPIASLAARKNAGALPAIVTTTVEALRAAHLDEEGLFRKSGSLKLLTRYRTEYDTGASVDATAIADPHAVAGLLKLWLRQLPEPVLTYELYDAMLGVLQLAERAEKIKCFSELVSRLPGANKALVYYLLAFIHDVSLRAEKNLMTCANLATVFGPNILRPRNASVEHMMSETPAINQVVEELIKFAPEICASSSSSSSASNPAWGSAASAAAAAASSSSSSATPPLASSTGFGSKSTSLFGAARASAGERRGTPLVGNRRSEDSLSASVGAARARAGQLAASAAANAGGAAPPPPVATRPPRAPPIAVAAAPKASPPAVPKRLPPNQNLQTEAESAISSSASSASSNNNGSASANGGGGGGRRATRKSATEAISLHSIAAHVTQVEIRLEEECEKRRQLEATVEQLQALVNQLMNK